MVLKRSDVGSVIGIGLSLLGPLVIFAFLAGNRDPVLFRFYLVMTVVGCPGSVVVGLYLMEGARHRPVKYLLVSLMMLNAMWFLFVVFVIMRSIAMSLH